MIAGLQVDLQGVKAIQDELQRLVLRGSNIGQVHQIIGAAMESRVQQRFDTKTDPLGHAWAAHAPGTIAAYKKQDTNKRGKHSQRGSLLERTRRMRNALGFAASIDEVTIGFGVPYAGYHEFGTKRMPRRGLLMADPQSGTLSQDDTDVILRTLLKHFSD